MRRSERAIDSQEQMLDLLDRCQVMHLGLIDGDVPYVVPLHYGWAQEEEGIVLYFHCALDGKKMDCIRQNPRCALTVIGETQLMKEPSACGWGAAYESLMMTGLVEVISGDEERQAALDAFMAHQGFEGIPHYQGKVLEKTAVCKVRVMTMTGKRRQ